MKIIRFILKSLFVLSLFIFGISLADKQNLSGNVIGLQVCANEPDQIILQVGALVESRQTLNAEELCRLLNERGITARCGSGYFESTATDDYLIPAGVYDTVYITADDGSREHIQLIATGNVGRNFQTVQNYAIRLFQKGYIFFLSMLGYVEKIVRN